MWCISIVSPGLKTVLSGVVMSWIICLSSIYKHCLSLSSVAMLICFLMFFHSHLLRMYLIGNDLDGNHIGCEFFVSLIRLRRGLVCRGLDDLVIFTPIILDYWNRTFRLCLNSLDVLLCRFHKIRKQTILRMNMKCDRIFLKLILHFLSTHFFKYHKLRIFLKSHLDT